MTRSTRKDWLKRLACLFAVLLLVGFVFWYLQWEYVNGLKVSIHDLEQLDREDRDPREGTAPITWEQMEKRRKMKEALSEKLNTTLEESKMNAYYLPSKSALARRIMGEAIDADLREPVQLDAAAKLYRRVDRILPDNSLEPQRQALKTAWQRDASTQMDALDPKALAQNILKQIQDPQRFAGRTLTETVSYCFYTSPLETISRQLDDAKSTLGEELAAERHRLASLRIACWLALIRSMSDEKPGSALDLLGSSAARKENVLLPEPEHSRLLEAWLVKEVRPLSPELARLDSAAARVVWEALILSRENSKRLYLVSFPTGVLFAENGSLQVLKIDRPKP